VIGLMLLYSTTFHENHPVYFMMALCGRNMLHKLNENVD
jgi:hypothetical protein